MMPRGLSPAVYSLSSFIFPLLAHLVRNVLVLCRPRCAYKTPCLPSSKAGNRGPFSSLFLCAFARPFDDLRACRATLVFLVCILSFASTFPLLQLFLVSPTLTARASPTLTSLLRQPQPPLPRSRQPTLPCHAATLTRRHQHNALTPSLLPFSSTQSARFTRERMRSCPSP